MWCKNIYLDLNVDKTREMALDLRKKGDVNELIIEGVTVGRVNEYKYLGTVLDNKLTFECNIVWIARLRVSTWLNLIKIFDVHKI